MSGLEAIWWNQRPGRGEAALLSPLLLAEGLFRAGAAARAALYAAGVLETARAGAPVVSIGNLAVGGAGKTPVALTVAARLAARGRAVAILSRGYGATRRDARVVSDGAAIRLGADEAGDEPALLARRLPGVRVLCGPRRAELAAIAVDALGADVLLLDDGFQHRALARDLDVVVVDATNPFGNGHLLPRGPNREPAGALARAGLVWLSRVDQAAPELVARLRALATAATGRPPVESRHAVLDVVDGSLRERLGPGALAGARVLLLCGLARPAGFRRTVEALGATVAVERVYRDHHRFTGDELDEALRAAAAAGCSRVVMTEKDAVRLAPARAAEPRLAAVRIDAEILRGAELLDERLDAALSGARASARAAPSAPPSPPPGAAGRAHRRS